MRSSLEGDLPYASARGLWARSASHSCCMQWRVLHDMPHGAGGFIDFHRAAYGRCGRSVTISPRSGGHIPESVHRRALYSQTMWWRPASYRRCRVTTLKLPCELPFLSHTSKKIRERRNRDRAHMQAGAWGPRGVAGDGVVDLGVAASASEPKP